MYLQSIYCIAWQRMALLNRESTPAFLLLERDGEGGGSESDWEDVGSMSVGQFGSLPGHRENVKLPGLGKLLFVMGFLFFPSFNCKRSPQANIPSCLLMWFVPAWLSPHPTPAVSSGVGGSQWAQRKQLQHLLQSWDAQSSLETGSLCFLVVILATAHCCVDLSSTDQLLTDTQSSKGPLQRKCKHSELAPSLLFWFSPCLQMRLHLPLSVDIH